MPLVRFIQVWLDSATTPPKQGQVVVARAAKDMSTPSHWPKEFRVKVTSPGKFVAVVNTATGIEVFAITRFTWCQAPPLFDYKALGQYPD